MTTKTRILGTTWTRWRDGLWRSASDARRVASSLGGAMECELALQHAARVGLSQPCNDGHVWKDTGNTLYSLTQQARTFNLLTRTSESA